jgi:hypothetical protein
MNFFNIETYISVRLFLKKKENKNIFLYLLNGLFPYPRHVMLLSNARLASRILRLGF